MRQLRLIGPGGLSQTGGASPRGEKGEIPSFGAIVGEALARAA
ncbi:MULTISPECIES: hypothetical protein [unclassified Bradyrhizobium]|nr:MULTISPECIES: hypothetical protein [unclassified Bradyrhizobium]